MQSSWRIIRLVRAVSNRLTIDMMVARELLGDKMPDNELTDEIFLYVVAGTETTAVTLSWYAKFITNHPEVQRKLRDHLLERIPELQDRDMEYGDVDAKKVPYLEAVVQECLRLSRTASGFAREARVDTTILGYPIPKGTIIITPAKFQVEDESMPSWGEGGEGVDVGSLDEKRYDKTRHVGHWKAGTAKVFDPERWMKDGEFDATAGPSMPFSGGQRGCFGKNLAVSPFLVSLTSVARTSSGDCAHDDGFFLRAGRRQAQLHGVV